MEPSLKQIISGRIASLGLLEAELPDPELGHAESVEEDEEEVVEAFFLRDFPDSQMEMEWRRRGAPPPPPGETCKGEGPHTRSFRTENESGMSF